MKILLLGASSYLGARLYFDLSGKFEVTGTYSAHPLSRAFVHLDVTDAAEVSDVLRKTRPDIVIHAANNASAKWCEAHPADAVRLNETSTRYISSVSAEIGAKLIYISSLSALDPSTVYGKTKQESEHIVMKHHPGYAVIRPSLILGYSPNTENDRPFNRILKNLDGKAPAVYDTSWKFQPTYIRHISDVISEIIAKHIWGRTITVAVQDLKSRFDVARDILTPFGIPVTPSDEKDSKKTEQDGLTELHELGLPTYTYAQMVDRIVGEIRRRDKFVLN